MTCGSSTAQTGPVGRGKLAANRSGKAMRGTEPRIRQRHSAKQAGDRHIRSSGGIAAIGKRCPQRARGALNPFYAHRIGHRVGARADIRFDELRERIQAGAGGDGGRQVVSQLRVNDCHSRQHERTAQAHFDAMFRRGKHGVAGDFGTRARSRRDRNERDGWFGEGFAAADHFQVIEQLTCVGEHGGNGLPASRALPPPKLITKPHFSCRASATPCCTVSIAGSPGRGSRWRRLRARAAGRARVRLVAGFAPVTTSASVPHSRASGQPRARHPCRKISSARAARIICEKWKSNYNYLPDAVIVEDQSRRSSWFQGRTDRG